ncbi:Sel1 domain-containing protein repeat-containing protein [Enterobacter asburiae]|uniref:Sel1 domain-containing protein repeat-containing protein n=1 Tax=Enterobacter asburiae TaxID=61645 RepID=A0A376FG61_ENTAS|nr:Sel1 domain-containing protein repeat-containing protein [Enterobacter asburiae]
MGPRKPLKVAMSTPWGLLSQILFTQGNYAQAKALAQQANHSGQPNAARSCWRACWSILRQVKLTILRPSNMLQTAAEDIDNDSAVDAQMLLG